MLRSCSFIERTVLKVLKPWNAPDPCAVCVWLSRQVPLIYFGLLSRDNLCCTTNQADLHRSYLLMRMFFTENDWESEMCIRVLGVVAPDLLFSVVSPQSKPTLPQCVTLRHPFPQIWSQQLPLNKD